MSTHPLYPAPQINTEQASNDCGRTRLAQAAEGIEIQQSALRGRKWTLARLGDSGSVKGRGYLMRQNLEAEAQGFQSTSLEAFLGEDRAPGSDTKEPKMVITPGFQESLSRIPQDEQRKIKKALKRLRRRKVR